MRLVTRLALLVNGALAPLGYAVCTRETIARRERDSLRGSVTQLQRAGFAPRTVIDVGVAFGTHELYETFPAACHVLIEPLEEYRPFLDRIARTYPDVRCVPAAASRAPGELTLHLTPNLDASTLKFDESAAPPDSRRTVPVVTLDQLRQDHDLRGPYLIKVDAEGAELDVIAGAETLLPETECVILEASLNRGRPGRPEIEDLLADMTARGFVLHDLTGPKYRAHDAALYQIDLTFLRAGSGLRRPPEPGAIRSPEERRRAFERLFREQRDALK